MADWIITRCNLARSWYWFRQVTAPCIVACGSAIMTVNSASGSTLKCCRWLWNDMRLNSPKRPSYCNSTTWFRFCPFHRSWHVILHQSAKFYPNRTTLSRKNDVMSISRWRISAILDFRGPVIIVVIIIIIIIIMSQCLQALKKIIIIITKTMFMVLSS